ncbi:MAG TPA: permease prefix domain 2-containing transporter, partial [Chryseolinea sp.]|nr:permease prefix domain 2-containing transporter [Chryseolinea sp.]
MSDDVPRFSIRFLQWFCPTKLYEGIEGDLLEQFEKDVENFGAKQARRKFMWNVMRFFRADIILRNRFSIHFIHASMIRNYLIVAFRNILKTKVFSGINIFGLGVGLAACMLIVQFVMFELSYDKFHEKFERTYRVTNDRFQNGKLIQHGTITYPTIGPAMAKDFPEVEAYTRLMPAGEMNIKAEERFFRGDNCHFADEHFLSLFSFPLLAGDRASALKVRYSIVLTETTAQKYFDVKDKNYSRVINKVVYWGLDPQPYKVTAVCKDVPENSHIQFDALVSYQTLISPENHGADDSWTWSDMRHYLVLKPGVDYKILESKFDDFSQRHFKGDKVSGSVEKFFLQPLKEAYLYSNYEYDIAKTSSGKAVWAMLIVAGFIMIIAWINYINLTTSRALERAKEVGLRKVMGAIKSQLIQQFIFESILISLFALAVALIIVQLSQNSFNQIIGGDLSWWKVFSNLESSILVVLVAVLIGGLLLSGFYPAFVLSSYQPITVLKGKFQRSTRGHLLRKGLVVFQFMASAALITGTIVVSRQLNYMNEADLGINIQNIVIVQPPERTPWDSTFIQHMEAFKHELSQVKEVINSTTSNNIPGARLGRTFN